ncbi:MAG: TPM domain-containing protein [Cytophagaceae bacterium]|nr:TPM domain-containing protein [Cytophagaceae bacterium]MDW8457114.1 TPM domain-containing protein [Cytophagaceae bacterium]
MKNILIFGALIACMNARSQHVIARPEPHRLVNDLAGILNNSKRTEALEYKLKKINDSLGIEIFIVTIKSLLGQDVQLYSEQLAYTWQNHNQRSNGLFILYDYQDRKYAIIPGTDFQKKFPPEIIDKIEDLYMKPHFRKGNFYEGFNSAVDAITKHITGELSDAQLKKDDPSHIYIITLVVLLLMVIAIPVWQYFALQKHHYGTKNIGFVSAIMLMSNLKYAKSNYENFKKGTGTFAYPNSGATVFGGGASGSWGGW